MNTHTVSDAAFSAFLFKMSTRPRLALVSELPAWRMPAASELPSLMPCPARKLRAMFHELGVLPSVIDREIAEYEAREVQEAEWGDREDFTDRQMRLGETILARMAGDAA